MAESRLAHHYGPYLYKACFYFFTMTMIVCGIQMGSKHTLFYFKSLCVLYQKRMCQRKTYHEITKLLCY